MPATPGRAGAGATIPVSLVVVAAALAALVALTGCGDRGVQPALADPESAGPQHTALPAPAGPFPVGVIDVAVVDGVRPEVFTPEPDDRRALVVRFYYPADPGAPRRSPAAPYMDDATAAAYAMAHGLPGDLGRRVGAHARSDARAAQVGAPFPVILFSHGLGETRFVYASLLEDLASRGYVVVVIHHPYGSMLTVFPDGREAPWSDHRWPAGDPERMRSALADNVVEWIADARLVLDRLEGLVETGPTSVLRDRLDLDRLGFLGHSYGGTAGLLLSLEEPRIQAVVNLDGAVFEGAARPVAPRTPFLLLANDGALKKRDDYAATPDSTLILLRGALHTTFSDLHLLCETFGIDPRAPEGQARVIDPHRGVELTRSAVAGFFDCYLKDASCAGFRRLLEETEQLAPMRK